MQKKREKEKNIAHKDSWNKHIRSLNKILAHLEAAMIATRESGMGFFDLSELEQESLKFYSGYLFCGD